MSLATAPAPHQTLEQYVSSMRVEYVDTRAAMRRLVREYTGAPRIYLDFEASGLDVHTGVPWILSLTQDYSNIVHVIDTQRCSFKPLKDVLENAEVVGANLSYDLKWLRKEGIRPRNTYDVVICGRVLSAGLMEQNSLSAQCKRYLGFALEKSVRERFIMHPNAVKRRAEVNNLPVWTEEERKYAATDVYVLEAIRELQLEKLAKNELLDVATLENGLVPVVSDMEYDGIYVDGEAWLRLAKAAEVDRKKFYGEVAEILAEAGDVQTCLFPELLGSDYVINLNSNAVVKKRFDLLGVDVETLNKEELKHVKEPVCAAYIKYKEFEKRVGTYGPTWIACKNPATGRIHSSLNQMVDTGRFSSSNPNIQNLPAIDEYRWCFQPRPGYKFVDCDFSTMEMRIIAEMSGDQNMIEAFKSGQDLHSYTAAKMYNLPYEECLKGGKYEKMRDRGKTLNFAIAYGKGPTTLALDLNLFEELKLGYRKKLGEYKIRRMPSDQKIQKEAVAEAQKALNAYFAVFPGAKAWLDWAEEQPALVGYSKTLLGRRRYFSPIPSGLSKQERRKREASLHNQGKNSPIQGSNADITKMAMVSLANRIINDGWDAMIVNVIHDELLVEVREDQAEDMAKIVEHEMVAAAKTLIKGVPIVAEPVIADRWEKG